MEAAGKADGNGDERLIEMHLEIFGIIECYKPRKRSFLQALKSFRAFESFLKGFQYLKASKELY